MMRMRSAIIVAVVVVIGGIIAAWIVPVHPFGSNAADAVVWRAVCSSQRSQQESCDQVLVDHPGSWVAAKPQNQEAGRVTLIAQAPVSVSRVTLIDHPDPSINILDGHLEFSDGTRYPFSTGFGTLEQSTLSIDITPPRSTLSVGVVIDKVSDPTQPAGLAEASVDATLLPNDTSLLSAITSSLSDTMKSLLSFGGSGLSGQFNQQSRAVDLGWNSVSAASADDQLIVGRAGHGSSQWSDMASLASSAVRYSDTAIDGNTSYDYRLQVLHADGTRATLNDQPVTVAVPLSSAEITLVARSTNPIALDMSSLRSSALLTSSEDTSVSYAYRAHIIDGTGKELSSQGFNLPSIDVWQQDGTQEPSITTQLPFALSFPDSVDKTALTITAEGSATELARFDLTKPLFSFILGDPDPTLVIMPANTNQVIQLATTMNNVTGQTVSLDASVKGSLGQSGLSITPLHTTLAGTAMTSLNIQADADASGVYTITLTGTSGNFIQTRDVTVRIAVPTETAGPTQSSSIATPREYDLAEEAAPFEMSVSDIADASVDQGSSTSQQLTLTLLSDSDSQDVTLSAGDDSQSDGGAVAIRFSPSTLQPTSLGAQSTMTINASADTWAGGHHITVTATSADQIITKSFLVTVGRIIPFNFNLETPSPGSILRLNEGEQGGIDIRTFIDSQSQPGSVHLTVTSDAPASTPITIAPASAELTQTTVSHITVTPPEGSGGHTYTLTFHATAQGLSEQTKQLSLVVNATCNATYPANQFHVCYYSGGQVDVSHINTLPFLSQQDESTIASATSVTEASPAINHDWGWGAVGNSGRQDNVTAVWRGAINFPAGTYTFKTLTDDGVILNLEGFGDVISHWQLQGATQYASNPITISATQAGPRKVTMTYFEASNVAIAKLWWNPPMFDFALSTPSDGSMKAGDAFARTITTTLAQDAQTSQSVVLSGTDSVIGAGALAITIDADHVTPTHDGIASFVSLAATSQTTLGAHTITMTGQAGGKTHSATFVVNVNGQPCDTSYPSGHFHACYYDAGTPTVSADNSETRAILGQQDERAPTTDAATGMTTAFDHRWSIGVIGPTQQADHVAVVWRGSVNLVAGVYVFSATTDDGVTVDVEGSGRVIDQWKGQSATTQQSAPIVISRAQAGMHKVTMRYFEDTGQAQATLQWSFTPPDETPPVVSNVHVTPNPTAGATSVDIVATAIDAETGLASGEYKISSTQECASGTPVSILPVGDRLASHISTNGWIAGQTRYVCIRAKDAAGNWSDYQSQAVTVTLAPAVMSVVGANDLSFGAVDRGSPTLSKIVTISNCSNCQTLEWHSSVNGASSVFMLDPSQGTLSGGQHVDVTVFASTARAGDASAMIALTSNGGTKNLAPSIHVDEPFDFNVTPLIDQTIMQGGNAQTIVTLNRTGTASAKAVTLSTSGTLPRGLSVTFTPATLTPTATATVVITTTASTPGGKYAIDLRGQSGSLTHSATLHVSVEEPFAFTASSGNGSLPTVRGGSPATRPITITRTNTTGKSQVVTLTVSVPQGVTAQLNNAPVAQLTPSAVRTPVSATLSVSVPQDSSAIGDQIVTVTATSPGSATRTVTVTVSVGDFTVSSSVSKIEVTQGQNAVMTLRAQRSTGSGPVGDVALAVEDGWSGSGTITGSNVRKSKSSLNLASAQEDSITLTLVTTDAAIGTHTIVIRPSSGGAQKTPITVNVNVKEPPKPDLVIRNLTVYFDDFLKQWEYSYDLVNIGEAAVTNSKILSTSYLNGKRMLSNSNGMNWNYPLQPVSVDASAKIHISSVNILTTGYDHKDAPPQGTLRIVVDRMDEVTPLAPGAIDQNQVWKRNGYKDNAIIESNESNNSAEIVMPNPMVFSLALLPGQDAITAGDLSASEFSRTVNRTLRIIKVSGAAKPVTLSINTLAGVNVQLNNTTVTPDPSVDVNVMIVAQPTARIGSYPFIITATTPDRPTKTIDVPFSINDFSFGVSPTSVTVTRGTSSSVTLTTRLVGASAKMEEIHLSVDDSMPSGAVSWAFPAGKTSLGTLSKSSSAQSTVLTLTGNTATLGYHNLTFTTTVGNTMKQATVAVRVVVPPARMSIIQDLQPFETVIEETTVTRSVTIGNCQWCDSLYWTANIRVPSDISMFKVAPLEGTMPPGGQATITVTFRAPRGVRAAQETLTIHNVSNGSDGNKVYDMPVTVRSNQPSYSLFVPFEQFMIQRGKSVTKTFKVAATDNTPARLSTHLSIRDSDTGSAANASAHFSSSQLRLSTDTVVIHQGDPWKTVSVTITAGNALSTDQHRLTITAHPDDGSPDQSQEMWFPTVQ